MCVDGNKQRPRRHMAQNIRNGTASLLSLRNTAHLVRSRGISCYRELERAVDVHNRHPHAVPLRHSRRLLSHAGVVHVVVHDHHVCCAACCRELTDDCVFDVRECQGAIDLKPYVLENISIIM